MVEQPGVVDFDAFFRVEYPKLVAIARGLTGDHDLACDLAQEALLRCLRSWDRLSTMDVPGAWVRRVVINLATDVHRSNQRHRRRPLPEWLDGGGVAVAADPVVDGWWSAVRQLPERQRAVVALHYLEDRSVADVAGVLGIAEGTVKATLAKARTSLARTLSRDGSREE